MAKRKFMTFNDFIAANVNERANRNVGLSLSLSLFRCVNWTSNCNCEFITRLKRDSRRRV